VVTYRDVGPPPGRDSQQIRNAACPKYPENFPDRQPVPVWVRIEWARDGVEWVAGLADRWNRWFVRVQFAYSEPRAVQHLTWVKPQDVRRRVVPADR
jgi:hypothetical protein